MANNTVGNDSPTVFNNFMHKKVKENLFGESGNKDTAYATDKELENELNLTRQELEDSALETRVSQQTMSLIALQARITELEGKVV
jgi:hypothetical protein